MSDTDPRTPTMDAQTLRGLAARLGRGAALRAYRVDAGLYVAEVAAGVEMTCEALHLIEDGQGNGPQTDAAIRWIAAHLETTKPTKGPS